MRKRSAAVGVLALVCAALALARHSVIHVAIGGAASLASGYDVRFADQRIGTSHAALTGLQVFQRGRRVFAADRLDVWYSLRDLLPGSNHRFGLVGIALDRATVAIVRYGDGTYDLPRIRSGTAFPTVVRSNPVPLQFFVHVKDVNGSIHAEDARASSTTPLGLRGIRLDASIDSAGRTKYDGSGAFVERRTEPFTVDGTVEVRRGYAVHRFFAAVFPLKPLANFLIDSRDVQILGATARQFDARIFGFASPDGNIEYHAALGFNVSHGRLALVGLIRPLENINGRLGLYDQTFYIRQLQATLAGIPMRAEGAIYDFGRPQIRMGVSGSGDMAQLRTAFRFSRTQPLSGPLDIGVLVSGSLKDPSIVAHVNSPRITYRAMPFRNLRAGIQYFHTVLALTPLRLKYGGIDALALSTLQIGEHVHERMVLRFATEASSLPYAGSILGSEPLVGDASVDGSDLTLHVAGSLVASRDAARAAALYNFEPNGVADVAPFWMATRNGSLNAGFRMDRPSGTAALWIDADRIDVAGQRLGGGLPGIALPALPSLDGRIVHAGFVLGGSTSALSIAGRLSATGAHIASLPFSMLGATFDGPLHGAYVSGVDARGPWGRFRGEGTFGSGGVFARGAFAGSLDALRPLLGGVALRGDVDGTVGVGVQRRGVLVQAEGLRMRGVSLNGIPVDAADGTLAVGNGGVKLYSAHVQAAGGDLVAAGSYPASLSFVASRVNIADLHVPRVPLSSGDVAAEGELSGTGGELPAFAGEVSVSSGRAAGHGVDGSAAMTFTGGRVRFDHALAAIDGLYGFADGSIDGVLAGSPRYDVSANLPAADVATAMRAFGESNYMTQGTLDANVTIRGSGNAPVASGLLGLPAASVNGLDVVDGRAWITASASGVSVRNGSVTVHTTSAHFDASTGEGSSAFTLRAPVADLSDFNDFFDTGDTLSGVGGLAVDAVASRNALSTAGDIDVRGFRFRSLPIGNTLAVWSSRKNVVTGRVAVGGREGLLQAHGSVALALGSGWQWTVRNSRYDVAGTVDGADLGLWVAAAGFPQVPITGRAFGAASIVGKYPELRLEGTASLRDGTIGRFPVNSFVMSFGSAGRRLVVRHASFTGPGVTATASGSAGLRRSDPVNLNVDASTDDLSQLLAQFSSARIPLTGAFQTSVHLTGTVAAPVFDARLRGQNVDAAGVPIEALFGTVRLQGSKLELHDAGVTFARGSVTLAGTLPIRLKPLGLPRNTPVNFTLAGSGIDASEFNALFGHATQLGGLLGVQVAIRGTVEKPDMSGRISLSKGSYSGHFDLTPITNVAGTLSFTGSTITVDDFSAAAGSGSVRISGVADFGGASGPAIDGTLVARGAQFDSPAYGNATIDGTLTVKRTTGEALLSGKTTITNATIPFAAFLGSNSASPAGLPWPLAFDLQLVAGQNVRVRGSGYGAGLDISGTGAATLGGTLSQPTLDGSFNSAGGQLTYFDRAFRVLSGNVTFEPRDGVLPTLQATGITTVVNPDPDVARNPYGRATITIVVSGPVDSLNIDVFSDPAGYSRQQILAMLAPLGGFVSALQFPTAYAVQIPGGAAPVVNNAPVPGGVFVQQNGTITVSQEAFDVLNAQFGYALLSPVENFLGSALGVSDVNLSLGYFGNLGVTVRRVIGKAVTAVYSSTFGFPNRQTFGIQIQPDEYNAAFLSFYYETGAIRLLETPGSEIGPILLGQPLEGQSGFSVNVRHFFK